MANVELKWNDAEVRKLLRGGQVQSLLLAECNRLAPACEAHIRSHLHGQMNMKLVDVRVKVLKKCAVGTIHAKSFKKGARWGGSGPAAAAAKHGIR